MSTTRATCSYKKKDGSLSVADDRKYAFWTPSAPSGAPPTVTIPIADVTNLQATTPDKPKIALKIFVKDGNYIFTFANEAARPDFEGITNTLSSAITAIKETAEALLAPAAAAPNAVSESQRDAGPSAAMSIAKALAAQPEDEAWYDDKKLKSDFPLQRSLLDSNKVLNERFVQALAGKPESLTGTQFTAEFWASRLNLLRQHAIEKAQKEGEYNVLPSITYTTVLNEKEEPEKRLNLTQAQTKLIFKQYPVVAKAFDDNVPPLTPSSFWERFFGSKLLKKLKGERIEKNAPSDPVFDKYLDVEQASGPASIAHIPHIIDLEGNEQNTKFRLEGDFEMRAAKHDRPILHIINNMSGKLLARVRPEDGEAHAPIGMDEGTFEQLQLRDLAMTDSDNRVVLNVREQQRHLAALGEDDLSADARLYAKQDPANVLAYMQGQLAPERLGSDEHGTLKLDRVIGYQSDDDDDDEDMDDEPNGAHSNVTVSKKAPRIGSHTALNAATASMFGSIAQRRRNAGETPGLNGLSQATFDNLIIVQNTTTDFLHQFWNLFHSGDASRAVELAGYVTTLSRSLDRINAVGEQAEKERQGKLERMREQVKAYNQKNNKRRRIDESAVGGGKTAVDEMVVPTVGALRRALEVYRKAYEEQMKEAGGAGA